MNSFSRLRNRLLNANRLAEISEVASIAVFNQGRILMGVRRDTGLWTLPGGHAEPGERIFDAAVRELFEETGIRCERSDLEHLRTDEVRGRTGGRVRVYAFRLETSSVPRTTLDPDREVYFWDWIFRDPDGKIPPTILKALHSPKNVVLEALGLLNPG